jgi:alkylated DNA repair dioxygenase AlkB
VDAGHEIGPPTGWRYAEGFLGPSEEESLLGDFRTLQFESARYKEWTARRRLVSYGARYDFDRNQLAQVTPIPEFLSGLRHRAAQWAGLHPEALSHASVTQYEPPAQLGWHRDVAAFEWIVGVSLLGHARMRFRPYPPRPGQRTTFTAELQPRSIYLMSAAARWGWQHAISPTRELRYSITFRSLRAEPSD